MVNEDDGTNDVLALLQRFDKNFQIGPQPVEGLITLNPMRMPGHMFSTAFSDSMRDGRNSLLRPLENVQIGMEFLSSSQSDAQYNSRFGQVIHDIAITNLLAEMCGAPGEMIAGDYANQAADEYMQQIIEDEAFPLDDDELSRSFRLRLRGGPGSKGIPNEPGGTKPLFNGVGLFKEHLPAESRTNPFTSLPTCRRRDDRPLWTSKFFDVNRSGFIVHRSGFIVQRGFYSIYFIRLVNYYLRSKTITFCLLPISYGFYCISAYSFLRYIGGELNNI